MQLFKILPSLVPGILLITLLGLVSQLFSYLPIASSMGISALVIAILVGMLVGNSWKYPETFTPGIQFCAKRLLRTAIILYGFRITFQQIAHIGLMAVLIDIIMVGSTLFLGYQFGRRILKLDRHLSLLISAGSAICGAAAVLAVEDVLKSEPYKASIAIGTVVLFGTLSMFLYPFLQHAGVLGFSEMQYGIFAGASVHEVAQALVAGANVSQPAGEIAVVVKMMRVLLLAPVLLILSALATSNTKSKTSSLTIPWFAIGFIMVIGFHSLNLLSLATVDLLNRLDLLFLTMAMGAIGMETKLQKIKRVGWKPLYLGIGLFLWLFISARLLTFLS